MQATLRHATATCDDAVDVGKWVVCGHWRRAATAAEECIAPCRSASVCPLQTPCHPPSLSSTRLAGIWPAFHDDYQPSTCIGSPGKVVDQNNDMRISRPPGFQCQYLPYIFRLNASIYDMYWLYYGKFVCGLMPWRFHVIHRRLLPPPSTSIVVCCCAIRRCHRYLPLSSSSTAVVRQYVRSSAFYPLHPHISSAKFIRNLPVATSAFYH